MYRFRKYGLVARAAARKDKYRSIITEEEIIKFRQQAKNTQPCYESITHEEVDDIIIRGIQRSKAKKQKIITEELAKELANL